ncbi:hypothetical protein C8R46DRAFT_264100 [Mycena filopes]|nr:hypothetical protein C8R46DRAFT_264100 [Mycena filopes]
MSTDSALFNFHGLSRALAEEDFEPIRMSWLQVLARMESFPFHELPTEIALAILKLATDSEKSSAYPALMRTSRSIASLARVHCVPERVVLSTSDVAMSFYTCISVHPDVGTGVKQLWLLPGLASQQAAVVYPAIIRACRNVERLACFPDLLVEMCLADTGPFQYTALIDVTFSQPVVPWDRILASRYGARLLNQLTSLRIPGGKESADALPHGISFPNLADLTMSAQTTVRVRTCMLDSVKFPRLARVVVTMPYEDWRYVGRDLLMSEPDLDDQRLCIVHCSRKWKELDTWKAGRHTIWNMGASEWNCRGGPSRVQRAWM